MPPLKPIEVTLCIKSLEIWARLNRENPNKNKSYTLTLVSKEGQKVIISISQHSEDLEHQCLYAKPN